MHTAFVCDLDEQEPYVIPISDVSSKGRVWMQIINHIDKEANITTEEEADDYDSLMIQLIALVPGEPACVFEELDGD